MVFAVVIKVVYCYRYNKKRLYF